MVEVPKLKENSLFKKCWYIIQEMCKAEKEREEEDDDTVAVRLVYERRRVKEYIIEKLERCVECRTIGKACIRCKTREKGYSYFEDYKGCDG